MSLVKSEIEVLRQLGYEYMSFATLPVQREKLELWKSLNRRKMQRPMVCIDQLPWTELNVNDELTPKIENSYWRYLEIRLRREIYKWKNFQVDMVLEPYIIIPKVIVNSGYGISPDVKRVVATEGTSGTSQSFTNLLNDYEDISKIKDMQITYDDVLSNQYLQEAEVVFAGIAPIKQGHGMEFHLGVWDSLTQLMGVEDAYYNIIDRPEFVHACVDRITDATISGIKQANQLKVHDDISNTCHCSYVYTDELLPNFGEGKGSISINSWAFGLAQLFTSVSPKVTEEFEIPYITRMAEYFGAIYYGCCDRLDDRLDLIKRIPNVRKVSCSPWSDRKNFAENIGSELIMSVKPSPALIASGTVNWDNVKKDLQLSVEVAKANNVNIELILKDISTVKHEPERLINWANIAMEVVQG